MTADKNRVRELRSALEEKEALLQRGASRIEIKGENVNVNPDDLRDLRTLTTEVKAIKTALEVELLGGEVKNIFAAIDQPQNASAALGAIAGEMGHKSIGELFTASNEFKAMRTSGGATMHAPYELAVHDLSGYGQKDVHTGSTPGVTTLGFGRVQRDPMVPRQQGTQRVRDLFPAASTSANLIEYFRVLGFVENAGKGNAQTVAEYVAQSGVDPDIVPAHFGLKPKSNLRFESATAAVKTIAHWEAAHRNVLSDEPQLQSLINNELLYGLALEEDNQILNGDGQGENLLGILNTSGIQTYTQVASDRRSDALRRAATLSIIANYPPTGYVLHPNDWEEIELQKADSGDGQYMLVSNFTSGLTTRIWRQPVVETPAITEGTFLTGAFGLGVQLYDREAASIRVAEQHQDFFVRNAVAVLAEERLALAVKRPESIVKGTFLS